MVINENKILLVEALRACVLDEKPQEKNPNCLLGEKPYGENLNCFVPPSIEIFNLFILDKMTM